MSPESTEPRPKNPKGYSERIRLELERTSLADYANLILADFFNHPAMEALIAVAARMGGVETVLTPFNMASLPPLSIAFLRGELVALKLVDQISTKATYEKLRTSIEEELKRITLEIQDKEDKQEAFVGRIYQVASTESLINKIHQSLLEALPSVSQIDTKGVNFYSCYGFGLVLALFEKAQMLAGEKTYKQDLGAFSEEAEAGISDAELDALLNTDGHDK